LNQIALYLNRIQFEKINK